MLSEFAYVYSLISHKILAHEIICNFTMLATVYGIEKNSHHSICVHIQITLQF